jgi:hypothetical protein
MWTSSVEWNNPESTSSRLLDSFPIYLNPSTKDLDIIMLAYPGGQERTEAQSRSVLKASGLELKSITPTTTMISVVEV